MRPLEEKEPCCLNIMKNTRVKELYTAYSINLYLDEDIYKNFDLIAFLAECEASGVFSLNELERIVAHRLDRSMMKGNISSKATKTKLRNIIGEGECSAATIMQDEKLGHDDQSFLSYYRSYDYYHENGFRTKLTVHVLKGVCESKLEQLFLKLVREFSPRYAFVSPYVLDDFPYSIERIRPLDLINIEHPIHNTNLNYFSSFVWDGGIKDFCWLNYFSDKHNSELNLKCDDVTISPYHKGTFLKMSDSAIFDENSLRKLLELREKNIQHIKSIGIGVD